MRLASAIALTAGLLVSASASAQSGRAEVSIQAPINLVKPYLINEMLDRGYSIQSDTPYMIVFDKVADNLAAMFLFGTRASGAPHARISYSMAEINGTTRVMADGALIGNAGTAFERRNDMNGGNERAEMQQILNTVANNTTRASQPPPAIQPIYPLAAERPASTEPQDAP